MCWWRGGDRPDSCWDKAQPCRAWKTLALFSHLPSTEQARCFLPVSAPGSGRPHLLGATLQVMSCYYGMFIQSRVGTGSDSPPGWANVRAAFPVPAPCSTPCLRCHNGCAAGAAATEPPWQETATAITHTSSLQSHTQPLHRHRLGHTVCVWMEQL